MREKESHYCCLFLHVTTYVTVVRVQRIIRQGVRDRRPRATYYAVTNVVTIVPNEFTAHNEKQFSAYARSHRKVCTMPLVIVKGLVVYSSFSHQKLIIVMVMISLTSFNKKMFKLIVR